MLISNIKKLINILKIEYINHYKKSLIGFFSSKTNLTSSNSDGISID